jgi:hypothetical protein
LPHELPCNGYAASKGSCGAIFWRSLRVASAAIFTVLLLTDLGAGPARAVPSFAIQTGQPCAACHVGAFGPQLKPYGRDFKLHGYVASDGQPNHGLPFAFTTITSFTRTAAPQPGGAAPGFRENDNIALDEASLYYAGRITPQVGAFVELSYDGVEQRAGLGAADVRYAKEGQLFGLDVLWGITANNGPTVTDPWNSTPVWGFPYNASPLAPTPLAATLVDGGLAEHVAGAGGYVLWNDLLYTEVDVYKSLSARALNAIGQGPIEDANVASGVVPYARVALIKDWNKQHFVEFGGYGLTARVVPGGDQTLGFGQRMTDLALDATYQFIADPTHVTSDMVSVHATFIHEDARLDDGDAALIGMLPSHSLNTFRADVSYSFAATVTPSIQYFRTEGTADPAYWATPTGSPNSDGMIFEVAYVPWGKPDSPFPNVNLRLAVQYINYFRFDGSSQHAGDNNNLYFSLWTAMKF